MTGPAGIAAAAPAVDAGEVASGHWDDGRGRISFRTLQSAGRTTTDSLTCGVAMPDAGGHPARHRHAPAEPCLGLEGRARVPIEGQDHRLAPGVTIRIPDDAVHAITADDGPVRFFYAFAQDSLDAVACDVDV